MSSRSGVIAVAIALVACVDDGSGGDAATQGALGGPCFANNTCNAGLACTLVNGKGICQAGDASTTQDATSDTTTSDAPADVTGDVGPDVTSDAGCTVVITAPCANQGCHALTKGCCEKPGTCGANAADCNGSPLWDCSSNADCSGSYVCCANGSLGGSTCPLSLQSSSQAVCVAGLFCANNTYQLCVSSSECPSALPTCTAIGVDNHVFGICQ